MKKKICKNDYDHTNMTIEWGFNDEHEWTTVLYGCSRCDVTPQKERFPDTPVLDIDHSKCEDEPCNACKFKAIQIGTGDANSSFGMPKKKWDAELNAYSAARKQGIQPAGTTMAAVKDALKKSDKAGKAYDANTGGFK